MDPITIFLLGGAAGGAVGSFFGWLFGKSAAAEEIERLQLLVIQIVDLNAAREAEIERLRCACDELRAEVRAIKANRGAVARFVRWVAAEEPEVIERYQAIEAAQEEARELEQVMAEEAQELDEEILRLRSQYPAEMAEFEAGLAA